MVRERRTSEHANRSLEAVGDVVTAEELGARYDSGGTATRHLPLFSDEALALTFADQHADSLRYVTKLGRWMEYDGKRWSADDTRHVYDLARGVCREVAKDCFTPRLARSVASKATVAAIVDLARADRRHAATVDQWDADPWLLNTPDGVVDLRTASIRGHQPEDYMTHITATGLGADCPTWWTFLDTVTGGDVELQNFLQRLAGYALTGATSEHALAFLYGTGANGKSVFLTTLAGVLGGYHKTSPIETFTSSNADRHPTELAMLRGARLVTAVETEEGRRWAESRIKQITGGDEIAARFMRQDFFFFTPQFKLVIAGNHKPSLRSVDEAMRRRIHLVPFTVTILPKDRDPTLTERLKAEWPGILQWAIEGCIAWQQEGLVPPVAVQAATTSYLENQDAISAWIQECCVADHETFVTAAELFASWRAWATRAGEYVVPRARLADALEARGFPAHRRNNGRGFIGLEVLNNRIDSDLDG